MLASKLKAIWYFNFPAWSVPLALLAICAAAFGLTAARLGFYWDDWPPQLVARVYGVSSFWNYYATDRPLSAWTYALFSPLMANSPLRWQLFSILLRWLSAVGMWGSLCALFPRNRRQAAFAAALFAVYPAFSQQSLAVTYHQAWLEYALYFASIFCMVQAARHPGRTLHWTLLSILSLLLNLSISEYFIGIELARPLILWFALDATPPRRRFVKVLLAWLPYLLILAGYSAWRLIYAHIPGDPNVPNLLYQLLQGSADARLRLQTVFLQDSVFILVSGWYKTLEPGMFAEIQPADWLAWAVGLASAAAAAVYLLRLKPAGEDEEEPSSVRWARMALVVGIPAAILGPLPAWLIDRQALNGFNSDRYALAAMFGASLAWAGLIEWAASKRLQKAALLCVMLGLAVSLQIRTANTYRWDWVNQTRFYWQLAWRAPQITPGTALFSEEDPFPQQSLFATSSAVNLLYPQAQAPDRLAHWLYTIRPRYNDSVERFITAADVSTRFRVFAFDGKVPDSLLLYYNPQQSACLWVLTPDDTTDPDLPEYSRKASVVSNLGRIQPAAAPDYPPAAIFGNEPSRNWWCYYYQKAALAVQSADWQTAADLGSQAADQGYTPNNASSNSPHEWVPFIRSAAQLGRWDAAASLTTQLAAKRSGRYLPMLCALWQRIDSSTPPSPGKTAAVQAARTDLKCANSGVKP